MDKKHHNWLGWSWLALVVVSLVLLLFIANCAFNSGNGSVGNIFTFISVAWFCIAIFFTPKIMRKTWSRILPLQTTNAKLIDKHSKESTTFYANGNRNIVRDYLVFELPDGSRKTFDVTGNIAFNTSLLNEQGILKFKQYKQVLYFISFEPDSPKDGAY